MGGSICPQGSLVGWACGPRLLVLQGGVLPYAIFSLRKYIEKKDMAGFCLTHVGTSCQTETRPIYYLKETLCTSNY
jgi:hypothetical protein